MAPIRPNLHFRTQYAPEAGNMCVLMNDVCKYVEIQYTNFHTLRFSSRFT